MLPHLLGMEKTNIFRNGLDNLTESSNLFPTMKTIRVVLDITYDPDQQDSPAHWDWKDLLDLGPDEEVKLISPQGMVVE